MCYNFSQLFMIAIHLRNIPTKCNVSYIEDLYQTKNDENKAMHIAKIFVICLNFIDTLQLGIVLNQTIYNAILVKM